MDSRGTQVHIFVFHECLSAMIAHSNFSSVGSLGACLPRPPTSVCTGIALRGQSDSLSSLGSFSFQLSDELIAICRYRATFTDGHGHFCFCLYRAGAQVNLSMGIVAPLSGRDGMAELVVRLGLWFVR